MFSQLMEYDRLIMLANTFDQPLLVEAANDANPRALTMKRKYDDLFIAECSSSITNEVDRNNDMYEAAMEFVAEFKQKKVEEEKRMDWVICLKEGKDLKILNYRFSRIFINYFWHSTLVNHAYDVQYYY